MNFAILCTLLYLLIGYVGGLLVLTDKIPGYAARKITHIYACAISFAGSMYLPGDQRKSFAITLTIFSFLRLLLCIRPLREKLSFSKVYFSNIERKEDGPYSLKLLFIQAVSFSLIVNMINPAYLTPVFYRISIFTLGLGDGLAEPIGHILGRYKYRVYSLFDTTCNYRTLAGSACVYIVTFLSICYFYPHLRSEYVFQLAFVPIAATALEAFSPKSVDNTVLFFGTVFALHLVKNAFA